MFELKAASPDCAARRAGGGCAICRARPFSLCASVPDADLAQLEALAEPVILAADQTLTREGDPAAYVYNVTAGTLRAYRLLADGRRQVTDFLFPGDFIGLAGGEVWADSIEAIEPATVCRFRRADYRALMTERRELEAALLARTGDALAEAMGRHTLLGRRSALERVAAFLQSLPGSDPLRVEPAGIVRLAMTRGEVADYLGLTLETVSRSLSRLKALGAIEQLSLTQLRVERPDLLAAVAEGERT
jgi:CRP/FNR family transcriptional regulator